jgi:hypothetical protein
MTAKPSATLKRLTSSVILYMVITLMAGMVAIAQNLPAEFAGSSTGLTAMQDFMYGMGTALSPPLYLLPIQIALLWLAHKRDQWGKIGVAGLTLIGLMTCIGALGEPINRRIFNPATFDPIKSLIMLAMILIPAAIVVFGGMEWSRSRKEIA